MYGNTQIIDVLALTILMSLRHIQAFYVTEFPSKTLNICLGLRHFQRMNDTSESMLYTPQFLTRHLFVIQPELRAAQ